MGEPYSSFMENRESVMVGRSISVLLNIQQPQAHHKKFEVIPEDLLFCPFSYFCYTSSFSLQHDLNEHCIQENFVGKKDSMNEMGVSEVLDKKLH